MTDIPVIEPVKTISQYRNKKTGAIYKTKEEWQKLGIPTVTVTNNSITTIKTAALTANQTEELLTVPLVVEGGKTLTIASSSSDSFDIAISYLNIKKEKVD